MDYVTHHNLLGVEAKEIPSITGKGTPTAETEGAVGCLYMDEDTGYMYKCVAASDGVYTWVAVIDVVQGPGDSETVVMSQKAATKEIGAVRNMIVRSVNNLYKGEIKTGGYYSNGVWKENAVFKEAILPVGAVSDGDVLTFPEGYYYTDTSYMFNTFKADGTFLFNFSSSIYAPIKIDLSSRTHSDVGDFYVTMRIRATQDETKLVIVKDGILEPISEFDKLEKKLNPLKGKTINCLGDSFTAPDTSWIKSLSERTGCICNNYGVANSRVSVDSPSGVVSFLNRYSDMDTNADITIIFGGINDAASIAATTHGVTLGTMESPLDNTTFYGALKLLITNIKALMPGKKIIGVIPPDFAPNENYTNTLPMVQEACREVYESFSIPYADLKKDCQEMWEESDATGYNNVTFRKAASDNWHPSDLGHQVISEVIQGTLEKYIKV